MSKKMNMSAEDVDRACDWPAFRRAILRELTKLIAADGMHLEPLLSAQTGMEFECIQDYMDDILDSAASGARLFKDLKPDVCAAAIYRHVTQPYTPEDPENSDADDHFLDPSSPAVEFHMYYVTYHRWRCAIMCDEPENCPALWEENTLQYAAKQQSSLAGLADEGTEVSFLDYKYA